jgi:hypothetical protein
MMMMRGVYEGEMESLPLGPRPRQPWHPAWLGDELRQASLCTYVWLVL